ncbi:hypothetical protein IFM89_002672 [Coptis chinensis]|uniref:Gamma-tubulin complex component n=1 Tax=Coptis chinensis TaxID=261450 RepID=A0A835M9J2_9MAGN|nr:hypothetical protein IFM89_002672 [Coptis chinensis]
MEKLIKRFEYRVEKVFKKEVIIESLLEASKVFFNRPMLLMPLLFSVVRAPPKNFRVVRQEWAAIRIQTAFRGFLIDGWLDYDGMCVVEVHRSRFTVSVDVLLVSVTKCSLIGEKIETRENLKNSCAFGIYADVRHQSGQGAQDANLVKVGVACRQMHCIGAPSHSRAGETLERGWFQEAKGVVGPAVVLSYAIFVLSVMLYVFCYTEFTIEIPAAGYQAMVVQLEHQFRLGGLSIQDSGFSVRWVYEGVIDDPYDEFFIAENKSLQKEALVQDYDAKYWQQRYSLEDIPSFLSNVVESILITGKYLNVMRECGHNAQVPVVGQFKADQFWNKSSLS